MIETSGKRGYLEMVARLIRRAGVRVGEGGDEPDFAEFLTLQKVYREAEQVAVDGMRARGKSWADIAAATGYSREAAYKKWGKKS